MRTLLLFTALLVSITLSAQFTLSLEQGMTISDDRNYKPVGLALNYQAVEWKGFNFSLGLAFDQVTLEEELTPTPTPEINCGIVRCFISNSWIKSHESRLILPLGLSRTTNRFTYGLQLRPGIRVQNNIRLPHPLNSEEIMRIQFGEPFPVSQLFSDSGEFTVYKPRFSLQIGTDFQYMMTKRISFGLNYRYEGGLNNKIKVVVKGGYTSESVKIEYFRGEARVHYLVAMVGWRL